MSKENKKSQSDMVEIAFINAAVEKGGKILDEMTQGKSILEYAIHESEMILKLEDNGIDKNGNRFDLKTGKIISIKGEKEKPVDNKEIETR